MPTLLCMLDWLPFAKQLTHEHDSFPLVLICGNPQQIKGGY